MVDNRCVGDVLVFFAGGFMIWEMIRRVVRGRGVRSLLAVMPGGHRCCAPHCTTTLEAVRFYCSISKRKPASEVTDTEAKEWDEANVRDGTIFYAWQMHRLGTHSPQTKTAATAPIPVSRTAMPQYKGWRLGDMLGSG